MEDGVLKEPDRFSFLIKQIERYSPVLVAVFYFLCNKDIPGFQYPSDEFGYLSKMIFLSGHEMIYPSQWQFGYSLFLLPVAWLTRVQSSFWFNLVIFQSLLWCATFYMVRSFIIYIRPDISRLQRLAIILLCALYPSWCVMAGFAFTSTVTVFLYMTIITVLCRWNGTSFTGPILSATVAGLYLWVHPTALATFVPLVIILIMNSRGSLKRRFAQVLASAVILIVFCILYKFLTHAIDKGMTASVSSAVHYPVVFRKIDLLLLLGMFCSHFATLGLTTLGAGFCGLSAACHQVLCKFFRKSDPPLPEHATNIALFCVLCTFAGAMESALYFSHMHPTPFYLSYYHWFYCRYLEIFTLPLLILCFLVKWRKTYFLIPCLTFIAAYLGCCKYVSNIKDNPINTISLATKNVFEYFKLLNGTPWQLVTIHLASAFFIILLIALFSRSGKTRKIFFVMFICFGIVGILYRLDWHTRKTWRARECHQFALAHEKANLENKVTWDSFFSRNKKPVMLFEREFCCASLRVAFLKSDWRNDTAENWLKNPSGILITDDVRPLMEQNEIYIYKVSRSPKYIVSLEKLPGCENLRLNKVWETGRLISESEFLSRSLYLNWRIPTVHTNIYFKSEADARYLHLKLSNHCSAPFFLNGKKLTPLTDSGSLWQCFDVSGIIKPCNELIIAKPSPKAKSPAFRVTAAKLSDRVSAERESFTRRTRPFKLFTIRGKRSSLPGTALVVPPGKRQYGPFVSLPPGCWEVRIRGKALNSGAFHIHYQSATRSHAQKVSHISVAPQEVRYIFSHVQKNGTFEFRCQNRSKKQSITVENISVKSVLEPDLTVNVIKPILPQVLPDNILGKRFQLISMPEGILHSGFYRLESKGRWIGRKCTFKLPVRDVKGNLRFSFDGYPLTKKQTVIIRNDRNRILATIPLPKAKEYSVIIPAGNISRDNSLYLHFEFPEACRPKNGDTRNLSFFLHSIELSREGSAQSQANAGGVNTGIH